MDSMPTKPCVTNAEPDDSDVSDLIMEPNADEPSELMEPRMVLEPTVVPPRRPSVVLEPRDPCMVMEPRVVLEPRQPSAVPPSVVPETSAVPPSGVPETSAVPPSVVPEPSVVPPRRVFGPRVVPPRGVLEPSVVPPRVPSVVEPIVVPPLNYYNTVPARVGSFAEFEIAFPGVSEVSYFPPLPPPQQLRSEDVPITSQGTPPNAKPTIPGVFYGKTILITGATGFIGKVLVEKLLRSCPGISEIIMIIRGDGKYARMVKATKLFRHKIFDRIKAECPSAMNKLRCIYGELTWENLGLEASALEYVRSEVSFVFNCAANVRFDCQPRETLTVNLLGVHYLLELCRTVRKLEAVVHVSTAYSFCNQPVIGEEVYPEDVGPDRYLDVLDWMTPAQLDHFCNFVKQGRPALYHVSKAIAEILIVEKGQDLPIIIVRPSIVTAAVKEPYPGWIDNYNGPSGFIALSCKGILKTVMVKDVTADWVPVDIVANTMIAAARVMALKRGKELLGSETPIINCVCPDENQITWKEAIDICVPFLYKYPSISVIRVPGGIVTSSEIVHNICKVVYHYLPACCIDIFTSLKRSTIRSMYLTYRQIHLVFGHLQVFTTNRFVFTSINMKRLARDMSPVDRKVFNIDQSNLKWTKYMDDYVHGVRKYFMEEKDETLPAARRRLMMLRVTYTCAQLVSTGILFYFISKRIDKSHIAVQLPIRCASQVLQKLMSFGRPR